MQAIRARFVAERTLRFEPFELPDTPGDGQILVQMVRTIISAGTELANYTGLDADTRVPGAWCAYPWTPGYGGIGRVLKAGPGVTRLKEGDLVYGIYPHATHTIDDTRSRIAIPLPPDTDLNRAIFARMAGVSITGFLRAEMILGDTVLIIGLGLVGNLCGQLFAQAGYTVLGLDPVAHRRALAEECGFTATLDPSEDLPKRIEELSHGRGARVVIDAVGHSPIIQQAVSLVARFGQVILLGTPRAPHEANMTPTLDAVHRKGLDMKGALEWRYPLLYRPDMGNTITTEGNAIRLLELIQGGMLKVDKLLSHLIPPSELDDAYRGLLDRKEEYLGVVVDWTQPVQAS
jgi:2-desacetyl-2-hydroxyethyl bacteriochlorophyllide A dehydrogenase